jgi:hypothetical protein
MLSFPFLLWIVGKGAKQWRHAYLDFGLPKHKSATPVKTQFASKVTMFEQCITYTQS